MPLTMLLTSHDANTSNSGDQKIMFHIISINLGLTDAMLPLMTLSVNISAKQGIH